MDTTSERATASLRPVMVVALPTMVIEAMLFSVAAPLLPYYVDELGLTKADAAAVSGIYGVGMLLFSVPAGMLVARLGPRRTMLGALALMVAASIVVGVAREALPLQLARFAQGGAGGTLWIVALGWVSAIAPPERRGQILGTMTGVAIAGALVGPPLGALAVLVGPPVVFCGLAAVASTLMIAVARLPEGPRQTVGGTGLRALAGPGTRGAALTGIWLIAAPATAIGLVNVIGPLRLDELSAGAAVIGLVFLLGAAAEACINPIAGRVADRRGVAFTTLPALVLASAALVAIVPQHTVAGLGLVLVATFAILGTFWIPGALLLTAAAARAGLTDTHGVALFNIAWALGLSVGGTVGGGVAEATGDFLPCALIAAAFVATFAVLRLRPIRNEVSHP